MDYNIDHYETIQLLLVIIHYGGVYTFPLWITFLPLLLLFGAVIVGAFIGIILGAAGNV